LTHVTILMLSHYTGSVRQFAHKRLSLLKDRK
jgi:hypothetical protein